MGPVEIGMTKRQVKRLLGRPHANSTMRQFLRAMRRSGTRVISLGGGLLRGNRYWLYVNVPPGYDTQIEFRGARVVTVSTPPNGRSE